MKRVRNEFEQVNAVGWDIDRAQESLRWSLKLPVVLSKRHDPSDYRGSGSAVNQ